MHVLFSLYFVVSGPGAVYGGSAARCCLPPTVMALSRASWRLVLSPWGRQVHLEIELAIVHDRIDITLLPRSSLIGEANRLVNRIGNVP